MCSRCVQRVVVDLWVLGVEVCSLDMVESFPSFAMKAIWPCLRGNFESVSFSGCIDSCNMSFLCGSHGTWWHCNISNVVLRDRRNYVRLKEKCVCSDQRIFLVSIPTSSNVSTPLVARGIVNMCLLNHRSCVSFFFARALSCARNR